MLLIFLVLVYLIVRQEWNCVLCGKSPRGLSNPLGLMGICGHTVTLYRQRK